MDLADLANLDDGQLRRLLDWLQDNRPQAARAVSRAGDDRYTLSPGEVQLALDALREVPADVVDPPAPLRVDSERADTTEEGDRG